MPQRRTISRTHWLARLAAAAFCLTTAALSAQTQKTPDASNPPTTSKPPAVESVPAAPMQPPAAAPAVDTSTQSSPVSPPPRGAVIPIHTEIDVRLQHAIDSAHVRNGDMIPARLSSPVRLTNGHSLPAGTHVGVTVVAVAAAGKISSHGELTLQVTHVGAVGVISDILTFHGQDGHKDLPDSAPAKGTEATVSAGATLKFHVPAAGNR